MDRNPLLARVEVEGANCSTSTPPLSPTSPDYRPLCFGFLIAPPSHTEAPQPQGLALITTHVTTPETFPIRGQAFSVRWPKLSFPAENLNVQPDKLPNRLLFFFKKMLHRPPFWDTCVSRQK